LSKALKDLGHHVDVVSGPPEPKLSHDIPLIRLPSLDLYNPDDLFRMPTLRELAEPINLVEWLGVSFLKDRIHKYDIVHDNQSLSYSIRALKKYIPTIATIHHPITVDRDLAVRAAPSFLKKIQQMRWFSFIGMQKKVSKALSRIITVSRAAMKDISREFKIPLRKFKIAYNGIDSDLFYPLPEIERQSNRIIVTNSAETPLKGLNYLLQAVAKISKDRRIELVVIGTPKKNGAVETLIRELGIGAFITFTGRIDHNEFVRQYARAAVAVIPSVYEGFGLPAGEAMACGLPVVSTTGGALPEVIGDAGILVPPAAPDALADAVTTLIDNPQHAQKLGRAGYLRVHKHFTWKKAAEMTVDAYRETIRDYRRL
jgi:glycosyltransferase involved in cell wall biosynthesis